MSRAGCPARGAIVVMTYANLLTVLRILLVAPLLYTLQRGTVSGYALAVVMFAAASLTDYVDGRLARRLDQKTTLGEFLDPLADKLLVGGVFVMFALIPVLGIPLWLVCVILFRELFVTVMRVLALRRGRPIHTEAAGKVKTAVQMFSVTFILLFLLAGRAIGEAGRPAAQGTAWEGVWVSTVGKAAGKVIVSLPLFLVSLCGLLALLSMVLYILKNSHLFRRSL